MYTTGLALLAAALVAGCNGGGAPASLTPMPSDASPPTSAAPTPPPATPAAPSIAPATPTTAAAAPSISPATPTTTAAPATPTPAAPATPTPAAPSIDVSAVRCGDASEPAPSLANVVERLGYALTPTLLPDGFAFAGVSASGDAITQIYQMGGSAPRNLIIAYPVEFSPDGASGPLGWERPPDAVTELRLGDQTAYIMSGGWSDASIIAGPALSPDKAEWDYAKSLALFFACRADDDAQINLAIQALPGPVDWLSEREIVDVAHALRRITP